eukprot:m.150456 g.150456  ORF g.150456 m.150456 type:complete len:1114 (-) comp14229_c1_seq1:6514-9855(-)
MEEESGTCAGSGYQVETTWHTLLEHQRTHVPPDKHHVSGLVCSVAHKNNSWIPLPPAVLGALCALHFDSVPNVALLPQRKGKWSRGKGLRRSLSSGRETSLSDSLSEGGDASFNSSVQWEEVQHSFGSMVLLTLRQWTTPADFISLMHTLYLVPDAGTRYVLFPRFQEWTTAARSAWKLAIGAFFRFWFQKHSIAHDRKAAAAWHPLFEAMAKDGELFQSAEEALFNGLDFSATPPRTLVCAPPMHQLLESQTKLSSPISLLGHQDGCISCTSESDIAALAVVLTIIEWDLFHPIQPSELLPGKCAEDEAFIKCREAAIHHSNQLRYWAVEQIMQGATPKHRAVIITRLLLLCKKLKQFHNYASLFAIHSAITHSSVSRLKLSFALLDKASVSLTASLDRLFAVTQNHRNYRLALEKSKSNIAPVIPYLALYMKDVTAIDNASKTINSGLLNMAKLQQLAAELMAFSQLQQGAPSVLAQEQTLRAFVESYKSVVPGQEAHLHALSLEFEPREAQHEPKALSEPKTKSGLKKFNLMRYRSASRSLDSTRDSDTMSCTSFADSVTSFPSTPQNETQRAEDFFNDLSRQRVVNIPERVQDCVNGLANQLFSSLRRQVEQESDAAFENGDVLCPDMYQRLKAGPLSSLPPFREIDLDEDNFVSKAEFAAFVHKMLDIRAAQRLAQAMPSLSASIAGSDYSREFKDASETTSLHELSLSTNSRLSPTLESDQEGRQSTKSPIALCPDLDSELVLVDELATVSRFREATDAQLAQLADNGTIQLIHSQEEYVIDTRPKALYLVLSGTCAIYCQKTPCSPRTARAFPKGRQLARAGVGKVFEASVSRRWTLVFNQDGGSIWSIPQTAIEHILDMATPCTVPASVDSSFKFNASLPEDFSPRSYTEPSRPMSVDGPLAVDAQSYLPDKPLPRDVTATHPPQVAVASTPMRRRGSMTHMADKKRSGYSLGSGHSSSSSLGNAMSPSFGAGTTQPSHIVQTTSVSQQPPSSPVPMMGSHPPRAPATPGKALKGDVWGMTQQYLNTKKPHSRSPKTFVTPLQRTASEDLDRLHQHHSSSRGSPLSSPTADVASAFDQFLTNTLAVSPQEQEEQADTDAESITEV